MLSRRNIILRTAFIPVTIPLLPKKNIFQYRCDTETKKIIQDKWVIRLEEARKLQERVNAYEQYYDILLNDWDSNRVTMLKKTLLRYKEARPDKDDELFKKLWENMNDDFETEMLMDGCLET